MLSVIKSGTVIGLDAVPISVEVDIKPQSMPSFTIVGLADKAVQESKERVRAALGNTHYNLPPKRITVNLAPADIPKIGPAFDLPIAIGLLSAMEELGSSSLMNKSGFLGELSLDGSLRPVNGVLSFAIMAKKHGLSTIFIPDDNAKEAALVNGIQVIGLKSIRQLIEHFMQIKPLVPVKSPDIIDLIIEAEVETDFADIVGQEQGKRVLEIAAAGGHNLYLYGSPGAGKTMLSKALAGILPKLTVSESLELTKIYSIAGLLSKNQTIISSRPFRSPHHSTSKTGLIGGGSFPRPGEISLAHRGILFLDEFPEFTRSTLEALRQPMEDGQVVIARAAQTLEFPCRFMLVAAANPCPCGNYGSNTKPCTCTNYQIANYQKRISGPMLDRIDLHFEVPPVELTKMISTPNKSESSIIVRSRVQSARKIQQHRYQGTKITCNSDLTTKDVGIHVNLEPNAKTFLVNAAKKLNLSARSYYKTIKVAQTIADLSNSDQVTINHISESLNFRPKSSPLT